MVVDLETSIADEFKPVWFENCPTRYRVIYGARDTGKSYTFAGLEPLIKILKDPRRNVAMFRAVFSDIKDTVFNEVQKALYRTGLFVYFQVKTHDYEIVYKKTGQKILFFGCDRGTSVNGIQVPVGEITDFYFEEAYDLKDYDIFRKIDGSLRGEFGTYIAKNNFYIPKQVTFLMNPWTAEGCWVYEKFVKRFMPDTPRTQEFLENVGYRLFIDQHVQLEWGIGIALHQSSYKVNHRRDKKTKDAVAIETKKRSPRIYQTEFLGMWGATGEIVYEEFKPRHIIPDNIVKELNYECYYIGVDTAYSNGEGSLLSGVRLERAKIHHAYGIVLSGMTRNEYKGVARGTIVAIDEYYHTQEITGQKKSQTELISETIDVILQWTSEYSSNLTLFRGPVYIFVDSGDAGSLQALQTECRNRHLESRFIFKPSTKLPINTRIRFERQMMSFDKMLFSTKCQNLARELRNCHEGKGKFREDINDHAINAWEYGTAPMYSRAKEWASFKQY